MHILTSSGDLDLYKWRSRSLFRMFKVYFQWWMFSLSFE